MKAANASSKINETSEMDFSEKICELTSARQVKKSDDDTEIQDVGTLLNRLSETPRQEIECLRRKTDGVAQEATERRHSHSIRH